MQDQSAFNEITRFINPRSNDFHTDPKEERIMIGLSGNFINLKVNTINQDIVVKELKEIELLIKLYNHKRGDPINDDNDLYSYSNPCNIVFNFLELLEKYYLFISTHLSLSKCYYDIKQTIMNLIKICNIILKGYADTGRYIPCYCDTMYSPVHAFGGYDGYDLSTSFLLYDEYCYLGYLSEIGEIKNMENYDGYVNRRDYRLYKKNFIIVTNRFGSNNDACHDYKQISNELQHWMKYFNQLHRHEMTNYKNALRENTILNDNCIDLIIEYI